MKVDQTHPDSAHEHPLAHAIPPSTTPGGCAYGLSIAAPFGYSRRMQNESSAYDSGGEE